MLCDVARPPGPPRQTVSFPPQMPARALTLAPFSARLRRPGATGGPKMKLPPFKLDTGRRADWQGAITLCCLIGILGLHWPASRQGSDVERAGKLVRPAPQLAALPTPTINCSGDVKDGADKPPQLREPPLAAAAPQAAPAAAASDAGAPPSTVPPPELHWFKPKGYELPQECLKHAVLYSGIFDSLRPWRGRGITKADVDACLVPAASGHSAADYPEGTPNSERYRLLVHGRDVLITSGGLKRGARDRQGLEYYQIRQVQDAARRFGLPPIEFVVGFGDLGSVFGPEPGTVELGLCPLMAYCKSHRMYDLLLPDGQFTQFVYDEWVERNERDGGGVPWEQKNETAFGRWSPYCSKELGSQADRAGKAEPCLRVAYQNATKAGTTKLGEYDGAGMPLSLQRQFKYSLHVDGLGCSNRLQKLMATGQVILKQDSTLTEFFYPALRPWVHYVPVGWNGLTEEADWAVAFLREHDELARSIGQNAQRFAKEHLNEEARLCYIKVLFEEMAKLMRYKPALSDFNYTISYDEDIRQFVPPGPNSLEILPVE